jgi:hypothetical protein
VSIIAADASAQQGVSIAAIDGAQISYAEDQATSEHGGASRRSV